MANKFNLTTDWTLLSANSVSDVTFQNIGVNGAYLEFTSAANTEPTVTESLVYFTRDKVVKANTSDLSFEASPNYAWARSISGNTTIIFDGE